MRYSNNDVERGGGLSNTVSGFNWAGIFGCDITAVADCTFHVNCLNAKDTPPYSAALPHGTIFYVPVSATPPTGALALYIMP